MKRSTLASEADWADRGGEGRRACCQQGHGWAVLWLPGMQLGNDFPSNVDWAKEKGCNQSGDQQLQYCNSTPGAPSELKFPTEIVSHRDQPRFSGKNTSTRGTSGHPGHFAGPNIPLAVANRVRTKPPPLFEGESKGGSSSCADTAK